MAALAELARIIASGEAMLFTGAGFSADARDREGNPLPDSKQMIAELWALCFDGEPDDSSLADLYHVALRCAPGPLRAYVERRLHVGDAELPAHLAAWFGAPWKRIYTLNVDDVEDAVRRRYGVPRRQVIHLNGVVGGDPAALTFSTLQYAERLCARDREYEQLANDLAAAPFVFVGTTLDEVILWQHVERLRRDGADFARQPAFLIARSLTRAREVLLESLDIHWIEDSIAEIAARVLR